jgi:hypothetical protein
MGSLGIGFACALAAATSGGGDSSASRAAEEDAPIVELERGRVEMVFHESGPNRGIEATAILRRPVVRVVRTEETGASAPQGPVEGAGEEVREESPFPVAVSRVEVHDGSAVLLDETVPGEELLRIDALEIVVENFTTVRSRSGGLPAVVSARGRIGRDGEIAAFATLNPHGEDLDFAGRVQVVRLNLEEVGGYVEGAVGLRPTRGEISAFLEFSVRDGRITGGVKPILEDVEVEAADEGAAEDLKAWFAQAAIELFSGPGKRDALATVIPIEGRIGSPDADVWQALLGVIENAFLRAVSAGFESLDPPEN